MRQVNRCLVLMTAMLALGAFNAGTASAQLDYTGPIHMTQVSGVFETEDGAEYVCEGSAEGSITNAGFPAQGSLTEINFTDCLVFGFIECHIEIKSPLVIRYTTISLTQLEEHIGSAVELTIECPLVGHCHYDAAANTIEGVYDELNNTSTFIAQGLTGPCGDLSYSATRLYDTPNELHW